MSKNIFSVFLLLILASCSLLKSKKKQENITINNSFLSDELKDFLYTFEKATLAHDKLKMLTLMDEEYKREQHDNFLE